VGRRGAGILAGVLGGVMLAIGLGLVIAEAWVERQRGALVAEAERRLGRAVAIDRLTVRLLAGGRVTLEGVRLGPDPTVPGDREALSVDRVHVNLGLLRTLSSLGRRPYVQAVEIDAATVTVVRDARGDLNWQRIVERLTAEPSDPLAPEQIARVRRAEVGRLSLRVDRIQFVDLARAPHPAIEIRALSVASARLGLARAFDVAVRAAVLGGPADSLRLDAGFGPAPRAHDRLVPPPLELAHLLLAPTELAPVVPFVAPFLPAALGGLEAGTAAADLRVEPGAALPGGRGGTHAEGWLTVTGGKVRGGAPFDARLDADLDALPEEGTLEVRRFVARFEDMAVEARGRLLTLRTDPRFEAFSARTVGLSFDRLTRHLPGLVPPDVRLEGGARVEVEAGVLDPHAFRVLVDLGPAGLGGRGAPRKRPGVPLSLLADGRARDGVVHLDSLRLDVLGQEVTGGGRLETKAPRGFDGHLTARPFAVRAVLAMLPGVAPRAVPDVRVGGKFEAAGRLDEPGSVRLGGKFTLAGAGTDASGTVSMDGLEPPRLALDLRARRLDVDQLLGDRAGEAPGRARPAGPRPATAIEQAQGRVVLVADRGRASGIDFSSLRADLTLARGRLRARTLEVDTLGGHVSGSGSEFPLVDGPVLLAGRLERLDVDAAVARFGGGRGLLAGRLSGEAQLRAAGTTPDAVARSLTGRLSGRLEEAALLPARPLTALGARLADAVPAPGLAGVLAEARAQAARLEARGLGTLAGAVRFAEGRLLVDRPLEGRTPWGDLSVTGAVGLDGRADLRARGRLSAETATALTGGRLKLDEPLPLDLAISGPLRDPTITPANVPALARTLTTAWARQQAAGGLDRQIDRQLDRQIDRSVDRARESAPGRDLDETLDRARDRLLRDVTGRGRRPVTPPRGRPRNGGPRE
jgi:hypothetical protein